MFIIIRYTNLIWWSILQFLFRIFIICCELSFLSNFWVDAVTHLRLEDELLAEKAARCGLTDLCQTNATPLDNSVLEDLGSAFSILWKFYWQCKLNDESWIPPQVFSFFLNDKSIALSFLSRGGLSLLSWLYSFIVALTFFLKKNPIEDNI